MKYTKKYPIHPKPDKQFSGASIFAQGGQLPGGNLTHRDSVEHQANKILKYEVLQGGPNGAPLDGTNGMPDYRNPKYKGMLMDNVYPEVSKIMPNASAIEKAEAMDFVFNSGYDQNSGKIEKDPRGYALQEYYRQNDPSKLDAKGNWAGRKGAPYSFDAEYNNTIGKLPENERRILMNKGRDWYYKNTNNPAPGVLSPDYNATWYGRIHNTNDFKEFDPKNPKFTPAVKAFGGFKYPNGGSFYDSSNINTSKPQVNNTVPSSYTDTFTGNNSSVPKTTKDGINFSKDGKALTGSLNTNSSGSFSGNYLGMATAAVGGIGTTVNNANAATNERDKNRAIERGTVDTTMDVVGAAFPIVAAVEGVAGGIGAVIDSTNGSTSYTDPNTGKTYNYKKGDSGTSASGFKAAVDPRGNATNFIGDITGTTENYGQSDFGMGVADLFAPFLSQAFRNKQAEKAANQAQMNNSLMNAQGVDSTARNFSAFGGYKNKFPYGGNMKSEVTGQSYLKDQVSDFTSNKFSKHEHGGVMVDSQNEVEAGEIIYKDYVFSERLKDSNGKSFAERAKKLISQIK